MGRVQFMNAIVTGKVGGVVYAYNKAGSYMRTFRAPTNPNTLAQQNARASFANAVTSWHSLLDAQKSAWNAYADTDFKPKNLDPTVRYSGVNAFISLRNTVNNLNRIDREATLAQAGGGALTPQFADFVAPADPPQGVFSSNIQTDQGTPLPLTLTAASLNTEGVFSATLSWNQALVAAPVFTDPVSGQTVGYVFYASLPIIQPVDFTIKPELQIVGMTKPIDSFTGFTTATGVTISNAQTDLPIDERKLWYNANDLARITAYAVSASGNLIIVGSTVITVTAP